MSRTPPRRASSPVAAGTPAPAAPLSRDSSLAAEIKALVVAGQRDAARERFADLVALQQRRAVRIAYQYLRDVDDADEAAQDAFVKVFTHITSYREDLPFEVWFTRILVNGCLDLRKSRARRLRWSVPMPSSVDTPPREPRVQQRSAEDRLVDAERARQIAAAVAQFLERERAAVTQDIVEQTDLGPFRQ